MALIRFIDLIKTLEKTRTTLLAASNGDGMVSRLDLKNLVEQTEDPFEQRFLELFYGFLIKLEDRPRMRVTKDVIDRGINFIQEQIIPNFEISEDFSLSTNQKISQTHPAAFPIAMELLRLTSSQSIPSPQEISEQIAPMTEGLYFDDYGSEAAIGIEAFYLAHPDEPLSPQSFVAALDLDPETPKGKVARFEPADQVLLTFMEQHVHTGLADRARTLVELMLANLEEISIIILGEDNHPDLESNHPVYVIGQGDNGDLAGFSSVVVWT